MVVPFLSLLQIFEICAMGMSEPFPDTNGGSAPSSDNLFSDNTSSACDCTYAVSLALKQCSPPAVSEDILDYEVKKNRLPRDVSLLDLVDMPSSFTQIEYESGTTEDGIESQDPSKIADIAFSHENVIIMPIDRLPDNILMVPETLSDLVESILTRSESEASIEHSAGGDIITNSVERLPEYLDVVTEIELDFDYIPRRGSFQKNEEADYIASMPEPISSLPESKPEPDIGQEFTGHISLGIDAVQDNVVQLTSLAIDNLQDSVMQLPESEFGASVESNLVGSLLPDARNGDDDPIESLLSRPGLDIDQESTAEISLDKDTLPDAILQLLESSVESDFVVSQIPDSRNEAMRQLPVDDGTILVPVDISLGVLSLLSEPEHDINQDFTADISLDIDLLQDSVVQLSGLSVKSERVVSLLPEARSETIGKLPVDDGTIFEPVEISQEVLSSLSEPEPDINQEVTADPSFDMDTLKDYVMQLPEPETEPSLESELVVLPHSEARNDVTGQFPVDADNILGPVEIPLAILSLLSGSEPDINQESTADISLDIGTPQESIAQFPEPSVESELFLSNESIGQLPADSGTVLESVEISLASLSLLSETNLDINLEFTADNSLDMDTLRDSLMELPESESEPSFDSELFLSLLPDAKNEPIGQLNPIEIPVTIFNLLSGPEPDRSGFEASVESIALSDLIVLLHPHARNEPSEDSDIVLANVDTSSNILRLQSDLELDTSIEPVVGRETISVVEYAVSEHMDLASEAEWPEFGVAVDSFILSNLITPLKSQSEDEEGEEFSSVVTTVLEPLVNSMEILNPLAESDLNQEPAAHNIPGSDGDTSEAALEPEIVILKPEYKATIFVVSEFPSIARKEIPVDDRTILGAMDVLPGILIEPRFRPDGDSFLNQDDSELVGSGPVLDHLFHEIVLDHESGEEKATDIEVMLKTLIEDRFSDGLVNVDIIKSPVEQTPLLQQPIIEYTRVKYGVGKTEVTGHVDGLDDDDRSDFRQLTDKAQELLPEDTIMVDHLTAPANDRRHPRSEEQSIVNDPEEKHSHFIDSDSAILVETEAAVSESESCEFFPGVYTKELTSSSETCACVCFKNVNEQKTSEQTMADSVPLIQVDGEDMEVETAGTTINNHTDMEDITDSEDSDDSRSQPIAKTVRKRKVKRNKYTLLAAAVNDTGSITDTEQIDVDDDITKDPSVTLAEVPNFYEALKPKIIELKDGKDGKVHINNIVSGIQIQEVTNPSAEGLSANFLGVDQGDEDPLTDVDSMEGGSDEEDPAASEELERGILSSYDSSSKITSEITEHAFTPENLSVRSPPGILISDANMAASSSRLGVPGANAEPLTDVEDLGVSDEETNFRNTLQLLDRNAAPLTDTEDIDIDIADSGRPLTPEPLDPPNGPSRRTRAERTTIEEDENGRIFVSMGTERDQTPSPYLSVHSDNNDPLTDVENYAGSESEDDQRGFETPEVEMFEGSNTNVRDREDAGQLDAPNDNIADDTNVRNTLVVPPSSNQALTDTEDLESSDIEERNITPTPEAREGSSQAN